MRRRSWTDKQLFEAVRTTTSVRQTISRLGLVPAGGNYALIAGHIKSIGYDTSHFTGKGWSKGMKIPRKPVYTLEEILIQNSTYTNIAKLKSRLFCENLKFNKCEECGWAQQSEDGRVPTELDHINGDRYDHRLENLRILCPNCHSLKPTHCGRNKKNCRGGETGIRATLKTL